MLELIQAFLNDAGTKSSGDLQTSFNFEHPPSVVFVKDINTREKVNNYEDLDTFTFSTNDQQKTDKTLEELKRNGDYDGKQLLIENLYYEDDENTIYIVARKANYSFLKTLQKSTESGGFDPISPFYQKKYSTVGVRVPFISTKDDYTFFMMRTKNPKVYSMASGYLEPPGGKLHPAETNGNLVKYVSLNEALEEFLGNEAYSKLSISDQQSFSTLPISEHCGISAIAIRNAKGALRIEVEFVCPIKLDCSHDQMCKLIKDNTAKDAYEHDPTLSLTVSLNPYERLIAEQILTNTGLVGSSKYQMDPVIVATSMLANEQYKFFPRFLPGKSTTEFVMVSSLIPRVPRDRLSLSFFSDIGDPNDENEAEENEITPTKS